MGLSYEPQEDDYKPVSLPLLLARAAAAARAASDGSELTPANRIVLGHLRARLELEAALLRGEPVQSESLENAYAFAGVTIRALRSFADAFRGPDMPSWLSDVGSETPNVAAGLDSIAERIGLLLKGETEQAGLLCDLFSTVRDAMRKQLSVELSLV
jgi:hypothetical protein